MRNVWVLLLGLLPALLPLLFWFSRRNLVGIRDAAFGLCAFVLAVPTFQATGAGNDILRSAALWSTAGAVLGLALLGTGVGAAVRSGFSRLARILPAKEPWRTVPPGWQIAGGCALVIAGVFVVAGFFPAFAEDPSAARFFRGEYGERLGFLILPYRIAWTLLPAALLLSAVQSSGRRLRSIGVFASGTLVLALALTRTPAFSAAQVITLSWLAAWRVSRVALLGIAMVGIVAGAGFGQITESNQTDSVGEILGAQIPDAADVAQLTSAYAGDPEPTMGRTMFGGLVPNRFEWNPSNWTLAVVNPNGDLDEISSGGFRVPVGLWGYFNFGAIGAFIFGTLNVLIVGAAVRVYRRLVEAQAGWRGLLFGVLIWDVFFNLFIQFATFSFYSVFLFVSFVVVGRLSRQATREPAAATESALRS